MVLSHLGPYLQGELRVHQSSAPPGLLQPLKSAGFYGCVGPGAAFLPEVSHRGSSSLLGGSVTQGQVHFLPLWAVVPAGQGPVGLLFQGLGLCSWHLSGS